MKPIDPETTRRILADEEVRCKASLAEFIKYCWPDLKHGWHLDAMCEHVRDIVDGKVRPLLINVPRQVLRRPERKVTP